MERFHLAEMHSRGHPSKQNHLIGSAKINNSTDTANWTPPGSVAIE